MPTQYLPDNWLATQAALEDKLATANKITSNKLPVLWQTWSSNSSKSVLERLCCDSLLHLLIQRTYARQLQSTPEKMYVCQRWAKVARHEHSQAITAKSGGGASIPRAELHIPTDVACHLGLGVFHHRHARRPTSVNLPTKMWHIVRQQQPHANSEVESAGSMTPRPCKTRESIGRSSLLVGKTLSPVHAH